MSDPTTTNAAAQTVSQVLLAGEQYGVAAAYTALVADAPFFGLPVISNITQYIFGMFGTYLYKQVALQATNAVIDIQTDLEANAVQTAFDASTKAQASGDVNATQKADQNLDAAFGAAIHSDGSYTP